MYDPEAPTGSGFTHWTVADIPARATSLPRDAGTLNSTVLPAGALQLQADAGDVILGPPGTKPGDVADGIT
jgi:phosphatidylethanolamine-binding protein (PEBP) family uncharacterized protein